MLATWIDFAKFIKIAKLYTYHLNLRANSIIA